MTEEHNPFQSPEAATHFDQRGARPIIPFQSGQQRAMITISLLAILAVIYVAGIAIIYTEYASVVRLPDGSYSLSGAGAEAAEGRRLMSYAEIMIAVAAIIAFSMWTHRASRNLPALGARGLRYTPGWAVGWFFVPIANLVMPYFVAAEIWRESDPEQRHLDGQRGKTTSPLVICWWLVYIARSVVPFTLTMGIVSVVTYKVVSQHGSPQQVTHEISQYLSSLLLIAIAAGGLAIIAALLAILYVYRVNANQQAKFDLIQGEELTA